MSTDDRADLDVEGFVPDDLRINVADLDSPEKIAEAAEKIRKSLNLPGPLTRDDEPYAKFHYKSRPQFAVWNRDRMNRDLIRAGQANNVPHREREGLMLS